MPFIIELACETQKQKNTIYKRLNTKDKSKKLKIKTQKAKDNKGISEDKNLKQKRQNTKDKVKVPKIKVK